MIGNAVFNRNGEYAGWNGMHGNVQAAYIRGKHGGMKPVSTGDGSENVQSKIWRDKVWKH